MANTENLGSKKNEQLQENENFLTRFFAFFSKYQNIIYGVIIGILVVILAILAFNRFYLQKKNAEASAQIVQPIHWFTQGDSASLKKALEGDGENDGFLDIASGYKITRTANTANYYAGLTYMKLGQKDEALDYLKKFKKKEDVLWYGCQAVIGDLYDEVVLRDRIDLSRIEDMIAGRSEEMHGTVYSHQGLQKRLGMSSRYLDEGLQPQAGPGLDGTEEGPGYIEDRTVYL